MSETFITSEFLDLSVVSASKKFVFADCSVLDRLCLFIFAFSLLLVLSEILFWVEELHITSVAVANV